GIGEAAELECRIVAQEVVRRGLDTVAEIDVLEPRGERFHLRAQLAGFVAAEIGRCRAAGAHATPSFSVISRSPHSPAAMRLIVAGPTSNRRTLSSDSP